VDFGVEDRDALAVRARSQLIWLVLSSAPSSWLTWVRRFRWVNPTALRAKHKAPSRAMTRGSPNRKAGALLPSAVSVGSATRSKAGLARTQLCPTRSVLSMRALTSRPLDEAVDP
jgi:hypothetical protein